MNVTKILLLLFLSVLFNSCIVIQSISENSYSDSESNLNTEDSGKCYAKCLIQKSKTIYSSDKYAIYTGNEEEEDVDVSIIKVVLKTASTKWVKKKADKNCLSANPDDCLVWCLAEVPAVTKDVKVLLDTSQSPNFEYQTVTYEDVSKPEDATTEWKEVLCQEDLTSAFIKQIQNTLREKGYIIMLNSVAVDSETKKALVAFQRKNGLPVGNLDFETLDALGIVLN